MSHSVPRVLIVDGEAAVRERLERVVRAEGCEAVVLQDGNEALEQVAKAKPDLIFLGLRLPGLDGLAVLKQLRSDPQTAGIPIIMLPEKCRNLEANRWQWEGGDDYLPRPPAEGEVTAKVRWFLATGNPGPRVLVVDDEAHIRRLAERILLDHGFRIATAENGREALEHLAKSRPDLVLLDVMMPQMDGFEVLKQLRTDPATADLPALMLMGKSADSDFPRIGRLGSDGYLTKPFTPHELIQCVRELLGGVSSDA